MKNYQAFIFLLFSSLLSSISFTLNHEPQIVTKISDIIKLNKHLISKLEKRYPEYRQNRNFFTEEQYQVINESHLGRSLGELILHKKIRLEHPEDLIDFALEMAEADLTFAELEARIVRGIEKEELVFTALRNAIKKELLHRAKIKRSRQIREERGPFIQAIENFSLTEHQRAKLINAYAICIDTYTHPEEREGILPSICEGKADYRSPKSLKKTIAIKTVERTLHQKNLAYRTLVRFAQEVAYTHNLSDFEKIAMAKCVSERSLRFFEPSHNPLRAVQKLCAMDEKPPSEAFFMNKGMCGNFSAIAYNFAKELNLEGNIFIARRKMHIYLEYNDKSDWYHIHPFNSITKCDFTKYSKK